MAGMSEYLQASFLPEPTERRCGRCGVVRPLAMFYIESEKRRAVKDGRSRFLKNCRVCQQEKNLAWRRPRQEYADAVKIERGCADCGLRNPEHPEIFDFDHLDPLTKSSSVSNLLTAGTFEDMVAEIAKCEVVCSNCHRIRTRARGSNHFGGGMDRKAKR